MAIILIIYFHKAAKTGKEGKHWTQCRNMSPFLTTWKQIDNLIFFLSTDACRFTHAKLLMMAIQYTFSPIQLEVNVFIILNTQQTMAFMNIRVICNSIETCHGHWEIINLSIDLLSKQPKSFYIKAILPTKEITL